MDRDRTALRHQFDAKNPVPAAAETQAVIDTAYDLAGKLLAEQRALTATVITAGQQVAETAVERSARWPCSRRPPPDL